MDGDNNFDTTVPKPLYYTNRKGGSNIWKYFWRHLWKTLCGDGLVDPWKSSQKWPKEKWNKRLGCLPRWICCSWTRCRPHASFLQVQAWPHKRRPSFFPPLTKEVSVMTKFSNPDLSTQMSELQMNNLNTYRNLMFFLNWKIRINFICWWWWDHWKMIEQFRSTSSLSL